MNINSKQRKVVIAGLIAIAVTCLFPPWKHTFKAQSTYSERSAGYGFIGEPPEPQQTYNMRFGVEVDFNRLAVQWILILSVTGIAFITLAKGKDQGATKEE